MKAVFIAYNQAHIDDVQKVLTTHNVKGFTGWESLIGAGSNTGEPHLGSHAWPTLNSAVIAVVADNKVAGLLSDLKALDEESPQLGLRAFTWNVEETI